MLPEAARAVARALSVFGNPGATHSEGQKAKDLLQRSRESIASALACKARELVFTSGLTEANNLAILGLARKMQIEGRDLTDSHWIVSSIEHDAVLECFAEVERLGGKVTHVDPDATGIISAASIARTLRKETTLVSVGWGNNEIGVVQPLREISRLIREHEKKQGTVVAFHSDAGQAPLYLHPSVHTLGVDLFALGSGKLYGPRGIGALYISNRVTLAPILLGGGQERGIRAGTEEPALAAGFASAVEAMAKVREKESRRLQKLRDELAGKIAAQFPSAVFNGPTSPTVGADFKRSLPHILNISIPDINAEYMVLALDRSGIAISTKSACNEGDTSSHVVAALGGPEWRAKNTLRISLGAGTKPAQVSKMVKELTNAYKIV